MKTSVCKNEQARRKRVREGDLVGEKCGKNGKCYYLNTHGYTHKLSKMLIASVEMKKQAINTNRSAARSDDQMQQAAQTSHGKTAARMPFHRRHTIFELTYILDKFA